MEFKTDDAEVFYVVRGNKPSFGVAACDAVELLHAEGFLFVQLLFVVSSSRFRVRRHDCHRGQFTAVVSSLLGLSEAVRHYQQTIELFTKRGHIPTRRVAAPWSPAAAVAFPEGVVAEAVHGTAQRRVVKEGLW